MNRIYWFLLRKLISKAVDSETGYSENLEKIYRIIWTECRGRFPEDNIYTLDGFLLERFKKSQIDKKEA